MGQRSLFLKDMPAVLFVRDISFEQRSVLVLNHCKFPHTHV